MIRLKNNNNLKLFVFASCLIILSSCQNVNNRENTKKSSSNARDSLLVLEESFDTILNLSSIIAREKIKIDTHSIIFLHTFKKPQLYGNIFDLTKYSGLKIIYNGDTITKIIKPSKEYCLHRSSMFFPIFRGDSIDNIQGFKYNYVKTHKYNYYIIYGYFLGCNGSFCENSAMLVLRFNEKNKIDPYIIGINRSLINLDSTYFFEKKNILNADIRIFNKAKKIKATIVFDQKISIVSDDPFVTDNNVFFCIE